MKRTKEKLLDLLYRTHMMVTCYKAMADKSRLQIWIDDIEEAWHELEKAGEDDPLLTELREYEDSLL